MTATPGTPLRDGSAASRSALAELAIEGMTCASCAVRIQRTLSRQEGVGEARVNFATRHATVSYDPAAIGLSGLEAVVARLGYEAMPLQLANEADAELKRERERRSWFARAMLSLPVAVVVVVLVYGFGQEGWARWLALALTAPI